MTSKFSRALAAGFLTLVFIAPAAAQPRSGEFLRSNSKILGAFAEVVAKASTYTVRVKCEGKDAALGTIIAPDGWIVTKYSELKGDAICRLKDGREFPAKVVGVNTQNDLAMLKIDAKNLPVVEWRNSQEAPVGAWVASAGLDKEPVAVGVVSVATRTLPGRPIVRMSPRPNSGYLGVRMEAAENGVRIVDVNSGTPADKCGIKVDDIVTALDDKPIHDLDGMVEFLAKKKAGDKITIKILRGDKPMELTAELARRPPDLNRGDFQNAMGSTLSDRRNGFPTILQHDTVIKPTDCGGPLVDLDGKTVGINIARAGRTESYAIPSELVMTLLDDLKSGKSPPPPPEKKLTPGETALKAAEDAKAKLLAEKAALEKKLKEADEALKKAKEKVEAEKKKKP
jgi:serine protease Do